MVPSRPAAVRSRAAPTLAALLAGGTLLAGVLLAALPAAAPAAGFGAPRLISPRGGAVDNPVVAVAPTGRVAVLWRTFGRRSSAFGYRAAIGPSVERLGRPQVVRAGSRAAGSVGGAVVLGRPGGGFVACFGDDPRRGDAVIGCSFAPPGGGFGPLRVVQRQPWNQRPGFAAAVRPDGRVALVLSRRIGGGRMALRTATVGSSGRITGARALATVHRGDPFDVATTKDGTVAVGWSTGPAADALGDRTAVLRLMPPRADRFGPPVAFTSEPGIDGGVALQGGDALMVGYTVGTSAVAGDARWVRRLPDGTFAPPLRLPRPGSGFVDGAVVALADGTPFAVSGASRGTDTDCGNIRAGVVGAGPLVPDATGTTTQRLSTPGQIALYPQAATLADGTVVATWRDAFDASGASRLEVALRPAGATAFRRPQVLPRISVRDAGLATGGSGAAMAWVVGSLPDGPSRIAVSGLRTRAPYAPAAPRPPHPATPCS
ncbi:hypothetical protein AB0L40_18000 [Patulibacter sp. NPDC049589]|uniref:hypothetical protein n=1 Tax=Patulibacter sp. NPDC049589 TaxID=3154731 RepID=UPI0034164ECE